MKTFSARCTYFVTLLLLLLLTSCQPKVKAPKNIIFLIGDGMGLAQMTLASHEKGSPLSVERVKSIGFQRNSSSDSKVTDSAASATALATGHKTYNGAIGIDADSNKVVTILELAEQKGLATGLIASSSITHATPASFIAHQKSRRMDLEIAQDFLNTDIDLVIGGGKKYFEDTTSNETIISKMIKNGYTYLQTINDAKTSDANKLIVLTHDKHVPAMHDGRENYLSESFDIATKHLSKSNTGFFMMLESSQIDWGGHASSSEYVKNEILDFDKVIEQALDFADKNEETLVVITGDHETGGLVIEDEKNKAVYKYNTGFYPDGKTRHHSGIMIPVYAYGVGAENFQGIYENTDIFSKMKSLLNL